VVVTIATISQSQAERTFIAADLPTGAKIEPFCGSAE
jgi:hypothetical protein